MRMQLDDRSESRLAAGLKAVVLIVLLGLIAVVSEPVLRSSPAIDQAQVLAPASVTPATSGSDATTYFPSQYPAPTTPAEQAPTF